METDARTPRPTADEARAALADVAQVQTVANSAMTAPWPWWHYACVTFVVAVLPFTMAGALAEPAWLLSNYGWTLVMIGLLFVCAVVFPLAALVWRNRTGMTPRPHEVSLRGVVFLAAGMAGLLVAAGIAFLVTGSVYVMVPPSVAGVGLVLGLRVVHGRVHRRKQS
ncbi:hypothetical protein GCM10022225_16340 [Plantactinospora mayteni]|uniref:Uncharacterized protein n=1 Tax=Plantactinospora mayteni TaxID=566021 RepID=A0ABQ4EG66_9ACTN|nr:hypothetical protein [Plantactinospora mayteni]GIG93708.1 hypothetical protein Pma05_02810 [Plantactinospora mayteni]